MRCGRRNAQVGVGRGLVHRATSVGDLVKMALDDGAERIRTHVKAIMAKLTLAIGKQVRPISISGVIRPESIRGGISRHSDTNS